MSTRLPFPWLMLTTKWPPLSLTPPPLILTNLWSTTLILMLLNSTLFSRERLRLNPINLFAIILYLPLPCICTILPIFCTGSNLQLPFLANKDYHTLWQNTSSNQFVFHFMDRQVKPPPKVIPQFKLLSKVRARLLVRKCHALKVQTQRRLTEDALHAKIRKWRIFT